MESINEILTSVPDLTVEEIMTLIAQIEEVQ